MKVFKIRFEGIGLYLSKEEANWLMITLDRYANNLGPAGGLLGTNCCDFHKDARDKIRANLPRDMVYKFYSDYVNELKEE